MYLHMFMETASDQFPIPNGSPGVIGIGFSGVTVGRLTSPRTGSVGCDEVTGGSRYGPAGSWCRSELWPVPPGPALSQRGAADRRLQSRETADRHGCNFGNDIGGANLSWHLKLGPQ